MVKLERIELLFQVRSERGMTATLTRKLDGDIEWDTDSQTVRLPVEDRRILPVVGNVKGMWPVRAELPCPECVAKDVPTAFEDTRALAAHRSHKHGVKGTSRQKENGQ